jgi:PAP2 superfamily
MHQTAASTEAPEPPSVPIQRSHWWREVLVLAVFYGLYTLVRDLRGDRPVSQLQAFTNARRVIRLERFFGVFHEQSVQHWFLHDRAFIRFCDDFYGTAHFVMVIVVLGLLFFKFPARYRLWRNTLALTTGLALIGFYFFPLMPPRMLPAQYHFVDTLKTFGGLWNFSSGAVNDVSNQYAAMPSLHTAWSAWCAVVIITLVRPWWGKALALLYPAFTIFCIVVTGNHYFADAAAGLLLLGVSYLLARTLTRTVDGFRIRRLLAASPSESDSANSP